MISRLMIVPNDRLFLDISGFIVYHHLIFIIVSIHASIICISSATEAMYHLQQCCFVANEAMLHCYSISEASLVGGLYQWHKCCNVAFASMLQCCTIIVIGGKGTILEAL